jgi:hypothetical protein
MNCICKIDNNNITATDTFEFTPKLDKATIGSATVPPQKTKCGIFKKTGNMV